MAYSAPQFNLLASIWDCQFPVDGFPDWEEVPCQKYIRSRMSLDTLLPDAAGWFRQWSPPIQLRFPRDHIAFSGIPSSWSHVVFEVPAGSGQFYRTRWQEVQHQGFPNEYAIILVDPCDENGRALLPPGASMPVDVVPDVCESPPPPPAVPMLQQMNFYTVDDNSSGSVGVIGRLQSETEFYHAIYSYSDGAFYIKLEDGGLPTVLADYILSTPPQVGDFVFIQLTCDGDDLTARIQTPDEDHTINATDATYPTGIGGGFSIAGAHRASPFNAYEDVGLTHVAEDEFIDTPGTLITAHAMDIGSGWYAGVDTGEFEIAADGLSCQILTYSSGWITMAMTNYP